MTTIRLVIFGRQGAGKGTQCARLVEQYGVAHISTGDMLRAAAAAGTPFGTRAKTVMDAGGLVSDDIMIGIVEERLAEPDATTYGFVLDGFPRTVPQAEALMGVLADRGLDAALELDVPLDEVRARMLDRGRDDDTPEAIQKRLDLYDAQTQPVIDWFGANSMLVQVDGSGSEDEVWDRLNSAVDAAVAARTGT